MSGAISSYTNFSEDKEMVKRTRACKIEVDIRLTILALSKRLREKEEGPTAEETATLARLVNSFLKLKALRFQREADGDSGEGKAGWYEAMSGGE
jgi:hypothetical protein